MKNDVVAIVTLPDFKTWPNGQRCVTAAGRYISSRRYELRRENGDIEHCSQEEHDAHLPMVDRIDVTGDSVTRYLRGQRMS